MDKSFLKGGPSEKQKKRKEKLFKFIAISLGFSAIPLVILICEVLSFYHISKSYPNELGQIRHVFHNHGQPYLSSGPRGRLVRTSEIPYRGFRLWGFEPNQYFYGLRVDEDGFISNYDKPALSNSTLSGKNKTIVFIGGSTVAGMGATKNSMTIPAIYEYLLKQKNLNFNYRVINAGVGGYFSANEYAYLVFKIIPKLNPDIVIILNGYNDLNRVDRTYENYITPDCKKAEQLVHGASINESSSYLRLLFSKWPIAKREGYYSYHVARILKNGPPKPFDIGKTSHTLKKSLAIQIPPQNPNRFQVDSYFYFLRRALSLNETEGTKILYAFQPLSAHKINLTPTEDSILGATEFRCRSKTGKTKEDSPYSFIENQILYSSQVKAGIEKVRLKTIKKNNVIVEDLSALFSRETGEAFYDWCHYTDKGNRIIAERLLEISKPLLE